MLCSLVFLVSVRPSARCLFVDCATGRKMGGVCAVTHEMKQDYKASI